MALTATLVEVTPDRLLYQIDADSSVGTTVIITNSGAATPDLTTDASTWTGAAIYRLVTTPVASQDEARQLLDGVGLTSVDSVSTQRGRLNTISAIGDNQGHWAVDATFDAVTNRATITVFGPIGLLAAETFAYVELYARHSYHV
jgi:hypothetical protein